MIPILDKLLSIKPRDNSGPQASRGFDFQKNWAICHLLALHEESSQQDYVLIFEHHKDIIEIINNNESSRLNLYQVKSNSTNKHWTKGKLAGTTKKAPRSILGKLAENIILFENDIDCGAIVSNSNYKFKITGTGSDEEKIRLLDVCDTDKKYITKKICDEFSRIGCNFKDTVFFKHAMCVITKLSVLDSHDHAQGKLLNFMNRINPNAGHYACAFYDNIFKEIAKRSSVEKTALTRDDLIREKGITKELMSSWCQQYLNLLNEKNIQLEAIRNRLYTENFSLIDVKKIIDSFREYELLAMDATNDVLNELKSEAKNLILDDIKAGSLTTFREVLEVAHPRYIQRLKSILMTNISESVLKLILLLEYI